MLLTSDVILDEAMERYSYNSVIMQLADGRYDSAWDNSPMKGDTIAIRLPIYMRARRGERADPQIVDERLVNLIIPPAFGSDSLLTDRQLSMELVDFREQVLEPHMDAVTAAVARAATRTFAYGVSNFVGIPGVIPTSLDTYQDAHRLLTQGGTVDGMGSRSMLVDAAMDQKATAAGRTFFNPTAEISERYKTGSMAGRMGDFGGATWYMEQAVHQHTTGNFVGSSPRVDGANQKGNIINVKGLAASTTGVFKQGDKLQFTGSAMIHPVLGTIYPNDLQAFTVAADVDSDGGGLAAVPLVDTLTADAPYASVSALPADSAVILVWGQPFAGLTAISNLTFSLGMLMHKSALVYASPNLVLPGDVDKLSGRTRSKKMKIGMRVWRASDVMSGEVVTRLDMLCGTLVGQPRRGSLICSA